ncbi:MAG: hypothetical protein PHE17_17175 [Thiothrix sp.]|uniref:hypothetical protein n=1 Tax=Thiothrix sp. TaxID=1032 RepID=UPI002603CE18|nr:hypothetical protein [Thiothrix sp.]MDD5394751.1 hypothetical protein [Thiothrix sp.]
MSKAKNTRRTCASCTYRVQDEGGDGWCELHKVSASTDAACPDYHQQVAVAKPPVIRLTKKQKQDIAWQLKSMTLAGAMALATNDANRFNAINDSQQAIIHALRVLGIGDMEGWGKAEES